MRDGTWHHARRLEVRGDGLGARVAIGFAVARCPELEEVRRPASQLLVVPVCGIRMVIPIASPPATPLSRQSK